MKKLLPLITLLILTACSNSVSSSSGNSGTATSENAFSVSSSVSEESSSSVVPSTSISSSIASSSSSSSSSSSLPPTEEEIFDLYHQKLELKNSTLFDEKYIEEKFIDGNILYNRYYGKFANQNDDGYFSYLDQGIYHYDIVNDNIEIGNCKTPKKEIDFCEFFYTTYDLALVKDKWEKTETKNVYTSGDENVSNIVFVLDGQYELATGSDTCETTLTIAEDGLSATYETSAFYLEYGTVTSSFVVKDLGTTTCDKVTTYLENASKLEINNEFPNEMKSGIYELLGKNIDAPNKTSYAHNYYVYYYDDNSVRQIFYEDFLAGDQVSAYRAYLESNGFTLSSLTDEKSDLKNLGYARYYYEIAGATEKIYLELYYKPRVQLDNEEKYLLPDGILHIRFFRESDL